MAKKQKPKINHMFCPAHLEPGTGPHAAKLVCTPHGKWLSWVSKKDVNKIKEIINGDRPCNQ